MSGGQHVYVRRAGEAGRTSSTPATLAYTQLAETQQEQVLQYTLRQQRQAVREHLKQVRRHPGSAGVPAQHTPVACGAPLATQYACEHTHGSVLQDQWDRATTSLSTSMNIGGKRMLALCASPLVCDACACCAYTYLSESHK